MKFIDFAKAHGVLISHLVEDGRWHRVRTETHPRKKNGAYRFCGTHAHAQDHSTMLEPVLWTPDNEELAKIDLEGIARRSALASTQIRRDQEEAAKRAGWVMHQCTTALHPYLESKGFAEEYGQVWQDQDVKKLCIPMRIDGRVIGVQTISDQPDFEKRFLFGQRTSEASYIIDNKGPNWFCEGYATALSVRAALRALKTRYTLFVCFSASNLLKLAKNHASGFVVADCDRPSKQAPNDGGMGVKVATETGLPFWNCGKPGFDFNDYSREAGLFSASQELKRLMMRR